MLQKGSREPHQGEERPHMQGEELVGQYTTGTSVDELAAKEEHNINIGDIVELKVTSHAAKQCCILTSRTHTHGLR